MNLEIDFLHEAQKKVFVEVGDLIHFGFEVRLRDLHERVWQRRHPRNRRPISELALLLSFGRRVEPLIDVALNELALPRHALELFRRVEILDGLQERVVAHLAGGVQFLDQLQAVGGRILDLANRVNLDDVAVVFKINIRPLDAAHEAFAGPARREVFVHLRELANARDSLPRKRNEGFFIGAVNHAETLRLDILGRADGHGRCEPRWLVAAREHLGHAAHIVQLVDVHLEELHVRRAEGHGRHVRRHHRRARLDAQVDAVLIGAQVLFAHAALFEREHAHTGARVRILHTLHRIVHGVADAADLFDERSSVRADEVLCPMNPDERELVPRPLLVDERLVFDGDHVPPWLTRAERQTPCFADLDLVRHAARANPLSLALFLVLSGALERLFLLREARDQFVAVVREDVEQIARLAVARLERVDEQLPREDALVRNAAVVLISERLHGAAGREHARVEKHAQHQLPYIAIHAHRLHELTFDEAVELLALALRLPV